MEKVDLFYGTTVPCIELVASLSESCFGCKVPSRSRLTTLVGAKEPDNKMVILLDPVDLQESRNVSI